jgi:hypothetical protein
MQALVDGVRRAGVGQLFAERVEEESPGLFAGDDAEAGVGGQEPQAVRGDRRVAGRRVAYRDRFGWANA